MKVTPNFGGEAFELDARLSFKKDGEGNVSLVPHFIRKEQKLEEYKEHKFSDEDRKNLRETGNLGRYNPQIEMFARFKTKSSFHKTKRII